MISVCMTTYNGVEFVGAQIESILAQIGSQDELIVADDGSTDGTLDAVREFGDSRIVVICSGDKPLGPTYNMERALGSARGDFIFLSDQDDVWLPGKVARVLDMLSCETLVMHDAYMLKKDVLSGMWVHGKMLGEVRPFAKGKLRNWFKNGYTGCCMAFRRELLEHALPFPKNLPMHDQWLGLVAERKFSVGYIPEALVEYRQHSMNATHIERSSAGMLQRLKWRIALAKALIKFSSRS